LPLNLKVGHVVTAAANQTLYWTITLPGLAYVGPIYVSANIQPNIKDETDYTVTTVQTSAHYHYGAPSGYSYFSVLRNEIPHPVTYYLSVGWFS
jgi:hypothetical protein